MRLLILSFILVSHCAYAKYFDHMKVQYAGEIGLLSYGLGNNITSNYSLDFFYGYVPAEIAGKEIQTYAVKNDYSFYKTSYFASEFEYYVGLNIFHVIGLRYQTSRFVKYPRNYYRLSSIRALLYLGVSVKYSEKGSLLRKHCKARRTLQA